MATFLGHLLHILVLSWECAKGASTFVREHFSFALQVRSETITTILVFIGVCYLAYRATARELSDAVGSFARRSSFTLKGCLLAASASAVIALLYVSLVSPNTIRIVVVLDAQGNEVFTLPRGGNLADLNTKKNESRLKPEKQSDDYRPDFSTLRSGRDEKNLSIASKGQSDRRDICELSENPTKAELGACLAYIRKHPNAKGTGGPGGFPLPRPRPINIPLSLSPI